MAALCVTGIAVAVHVPRAEVGEAFVLRRDPAQRRRLPAISRRVFAAGSEAAVGQSGLAHPRRTSAGGRHAGDVPTVADFGVVVERGECRDLVGFYRTLSSRRHAANSSEAGCDGWLRHQLLSRLRGADQEIPRADRYRTGGAAGSARCAVAIAAAVIGRGHPERGLRDRPARAVPRCGEERQGWPAGRLARLVQHALSGAARPGKRPALRIVRGGVWPLECRDDDRRRAGAVGIAGPLPHPRTNSEATNGDGRPAAISAMAVPDYAIILGLNRPSRRREADNTGGFPCSSGFRRKRLRIAVPRNGRRGSIWRRRTGWPSIRVSARASSTTSPSWCQARATATTRSRSGCTGPK